MVLSLGSSVSSSLAASLSISLDISLDNPSLSASSPPPGHMHKGMIVSLHASSGTERLLAF